MPDPLVLYDFPNEVGLTGWYLMDDVVMGGRSEGQLELSDSGHGVYSGKVSLENNGGFSSLRFSPGETAVQTYTKCSFRIKGDGKRYQFRIKTNARDRHSYIIFFETTGDWETITIPIHEMYPSFRGRRLDMDNYPGELLSEISFLIGNKKEEQFKLEMDWMKME